MPPTEPTPAAADPRLEQLKKYLDLLSIFHYVVAGLAFLFSLLSLIYIALGGVMLINPQAMADGGQAPPALAGCFILGIGLFVLVLAWCYAGLTAFAGRCLARRRRYVLCLVTAALNTLFTPFGTVLAIFTIIVLVQPGVRELFDGPAASG